MNGNNWYAEAPRNWLAVARQLAEWNTGERPVALRGYACVSPRAAARGRATAWTCVDAKTPSNVKQSVNEL